MLRIWHANGLKRGTRRRYSDWVQLFLVDCEHRGCRPDDELTRDAVDGFARRYAHERDVDPASVRAGARSALRAWAWGLSACGVKVPEWIVPARAKPLSPILLEFAQHRRACRGVAVSTLAGETADLRQLFRFLRARLRPVTRVRLADIDAYVCKLRERLARRTVARVCQSIRAFLRFLHATGRLRQDIASSVAAPRYRASERPPRALPWASVQTIIRSIDRRTRVGRRDHALLLAMATYGLGSAEVRGLNIEDVEWTEARLHVRRPKTGHEIVLPLLPAVARALPAYLRNGRPQHATSRALFVQMRAPHRALASSSAVRHVLGKHARAAGIGGPFLGSHALRHSHATRQIEIGASQRIVGDILGHRSPNSTSAYVRVALGRLRHLALPVPR